MPSRSTDTVLDYLLSPHGAGLLCATRADLRVWIDGSSRTVCVTPFREISLRFCADAPEAWCCDHLEAGTCAHPRRCVKREGAP